MKEFVVLDASDTVIDRAAVRKNLTTDGQTGTRTILHADGNFFVGDKIVNGSVIPVEAPGTERQAAKESVVLFLDAWKEGDAVLAQRYLTENAVLQEQGGMFSLQQGFSDYAIVKIEKLEKGGFRAQVEKQTEQGLPKQVEVLLVRKILDAYYVDSVEIAG